MRFSRPAPSCRDIKFAAVMHHCAAPAFSPRVGSFDYPEHGKNREPGIVSASYAQGVSST